MTLRFFFQNTDKIRIKKKELGLIIERIAEKNHLFAGKIDIILTDDIGLQRINKKFLNRSDYTDIITFFNKGKEKVSGELYISVDRIRANAVKFSFNHFENELYRIIIHGILHVVGFDDIEIHEKKQMTQMEDYYLNELNLLIKKSN